MGLPGAGGHGTFLVLVLGIWVGASVPFSWGRSKKETVLEVGKEYFSEGEPDSDNGH